MKVKLEFLESVRKGVNALRELKGHGVLVTHHDTDGMTSGYILKTLMERLGLDFDVHVVPFISSVVDTLPDQDYDYYVFSDIGAGQQKILEERIGTDKPVIIFDHHPYEYRSDKYVVVNPVDYGYDSQSDLCAAGLAYIAYRTALGFDEKMLWIGITGTIGDVQDADNNIKGLNREVLLHDAEKRSDFIYYDEYVLRAPKLFIVPVWYTVTYNYILKLPGYYLNRNATVQKLSSIGVPPLKKYYELDISEKTRFHNWIKLTLKEHGIDQTGKFGEFINSKYWPSDECFNEDACFILYHARTFAQYINMAARIGKFEDVFRVFDTMDASRLLEIEMETRELRSRINSVVQTSDVIHTPMGDILVIDKDIPPEFSGLVANMISNNKVGIALIKAKGYYKVSGRASGEAPYNIGEMFREVSLKLGTDGGGHESAGGMVLPEDKLDDFLELMRSNKNTYKNS